MIPTLIEEAESIAECLNDGDHEEAYRQLIYGVHWLGGDDAKRREIIDAVKARVKDRAVFDAFIRDAAVKSKPAGGTP